MYFLVLNQSPNGFCRLYFSFSFVAKIKRKKRYQKKEKMRAVFYALLAFEAYLARTSRLDRQAGSLTLTIRAHALRSWCAPCYALLPTRKFCAFPLHGGGYRIFLNLILAHNSHLVGEMSTELTEREG